MEIKNLMKEFIKLYGEGEIKKFFSPGRVNLIGEHIDYNGGCVFPCALDFGTLGLVKKREDNVLRLASTNFDLKVCSSLTDLKYKKEDEWANYAKGILKVMSDKGYKIGGMDILVSGNIPNGAGLSSSASLEVLIADIVNYLFNNGKIDKIKLAKIGQECENKFVGVNCGIMDQFAVAMGKKDKAIMLQCDSLKYKYADFKLGDYTLIIMNTNKRRALNESKYNERREECDKALKVIQNKKDVKNLCSLTKKEFDEIEKYLKKENIRNRAKHAVYENERVKRAYDCLNEGKVEEFGNLLIKSHNSLRDLYKVTGKELDTIVSEAIKFKGCIGARMTGAGFGGCAIALVKKDLVNDFMKEVNKNYKEKIGYEASFYLSDIGEGTHIIK